MPPQPSAGRLRYTPSRGPLGRTVSRPSPHNMAPHNMASHELRAALGFQFRQQVLDAVFFFERGQAVFHVVG